MLEKKQRFPSLLNNSFDQLSKAQNNDRKPRNFQEPAETEEPVPVQTSGHKEKRSQEQQKQQPQINFM